jgi:hypothetical protein
MVVVVVPLIIYWNGEFPGESEPHARLFQFPAAYWGDHSTFRSVSFWIYSPKDAPLPKVPSNQPLARDSGLANMLSINRASFPSIETRLVVDVLALVGLVGDGLSHEVEAIRAHALRDGLLHGRHRSLVTIKLATPDERDSSLVVSKTEMRKKRGRTIRQRSRSCRSRA